MYIPRLLLLIIFVILYYKSEKKYRIDSNYGALVFMFFGFFGVLSIISAFPFEKLILNFKTYNKAFEYEYFDAKVLKEYVGDDYAYIIYQSRDDNVGMVHYIKKDDKWKSDTFLDGFQLKRLRFDKNEVMINKIKDNNTFTVCIIEPNNMDSFIIKSSNGDNFDKISTKSSDMFCSSTKGNIYEYWVEINDTKYEFKNYSI